MAETGKMYVKLKKGLFCGECDMLESSLAIFGHSLRLPLAPNHVLTWSCCLCPDLPSQLLSGEQSPGITHCW